MCGICGVYNADQRPAELSVVRRMRERLVHRGPDDEGEFLDGPAGLGFRRLSILDLEGGHQPMTSRDGKVALVFNGEIYNHPQLKSQLESGGARYRTRTDTETILNLYERDGAAAFRRLVGMFAVALWDSRKREFLLARDPMGIKPLYYSFDGKTLLFSSEVRSLLACGLDAALDHAGVVDYLAYGKVHAPRTVFREILKLPPGHILRIAPDGLHLERYWRLPKRKADPSLGLDEAVPELDALLSDAVKGAMLSDVPVGAFLSGGVDSTLVAAYMVRHSGTSRVQTFSVGFEGARDGVDESSFAREAAEHLGTDHHALTLKAGVLDELQDSIGLLDEPIADSAILPTFLLSQFARKSVKVVLTGEGADELFAGYNRYKAAYINERMRDLPEWGRRLAAPVARRLGKGEVFKNLPYADARQWALATASARPEELRAILNKDFWEASRQTDPMDWLKEFDAMDDLNDALAFDLGTVMVDSLLMKVDKSAMRASLEARVPFLNTPVVEYAAGLPSRFKMRHFKGKYLLRKVAEKHIPKSLAWRRKHGFIVPWESWVRKKDNASLDGLLESKSLAECGVFDVARLKVFRAELVRGSREVEAGLFFRIALFGLWLESLGVKSPAAR
ncbi:MAG: asparagine synthase (glutamine-hydrolyzing) [Elusimicrobia bacterium]|nr:asparagine synthase (glutamine-hydrolyzing) [Elusimicrobiota bacterium]